MTIIVERRLVLDLRLASTSMEAIEAALDRIEARIIQATEEPALATKAGAVAIVWGGAARPGPRR